MSNTVKSRKVEALPCKLTAAEFVDRAHELAKVDSDIRAAEGKFESMRQQMKAEVAELEARRTRLSSVVERGEEVREVEVEVQLDYTLGHVIRLRLDTGEVMDERKMNDSERQTTLAH